MKTVRVKVWWHEEFSLVHIKEWTDDPRRMKQRGYIEATATISPVAVAKKKKKAKAKKGAK